jgi:hypothetical protein
MRRWAPLGILVPVFVGCGYQLAQVPADPMGPFVVVGEAVAVPAAGTVAGVEAGARAELSRSGQLGRCDPEAPGCTALVVEVMRVDEGGTAPGVGPSGAPLDRASEVVLVGRAYVRRAPGARGERDTGDVVVRETAGRIDDAAGAVMTREEILARAARRLGEALVRRALGIPEPP